jgi:hypothetical protein
MHGGYYAVAGWDDAKKGYAAWLFDAQGKELHYWPLDYRLAGLADKWADDDGPHGFAVMPDGSVIVNFDAAHVLARYDACGQPVWKRQGVFHHQMSRAEDGALWSWRSDDFTAYGHYQYLVKFDAGTGEPMRQIGLVEDVLKDPQARVVFGVSPEFKFRKLESAPPKPYLYDIWHPNDVEELSAALAPRFPMFQAGDLLISIRQINLVAVLDGRNYRVKWSSHGPWFGQHDPDFTEDGLISVYDNNRGRGRSAIVRIDPATRQVSRLPAGRNADWYSEYMGQHQYLPNGNVFIVAPGEGRAFERSGDGELVMEFNNVPAAHSKFNDHVENGAWLPDGYFTSMPACGG